MNKKVEQDSEREREQDLFRTGHGTRTAFTELVPVLVPGLVPL